MKTIVIILIYFIIGFCCSLSLRLIYRSRKKRGLATFLVSESEANFWFAVSLITVFFPIILTIFIVAYISWGILVMGFEFYIKLMTKKIIDKK